MPPRFKNAGEAVDAGYLKPWPGMDRSRQTWSKEEVDTLWNWWWQWRRKNRENREIPERVLLAAHRAELTMGTFVRPEDHTLIGLTWNEWQLERLRRMVVAALDEV